MYCECGCGEKTNPAPQTVRRDGWVKGKPMRFLKGHNSRTPENRKRAAVRAGELGKSQTGKKNHLWKGDDASYSSIHHWMIRHYEKTGICEECGGERTTQWANPSHTYRRVREEWRELCVPCHRKSDSWSEKMLITRRKNHGY